MPKLSVDRRCVVSHPSNHEIKIQKIQITFRQKLRQLVTKHIKDYHIEKDKEPSMSLSL